MTTWAVRILTALAMTSMLVGCARPDGAPSPRLAVQQQAAVIHVRGEGTVEGGPIACRADGGVCEARFDDLWATHLVARPAPGWSFDGWRRAASSPLATDEASYEAVFIPASAAAVSAQAQ